MALLTSALEKQVTARLRERGLVFWLDKDGLYSGFVDRLAERHHAGDFFAPVVAFRGSFLETLLALETYENGLDPEPLLIHLPGHTDATVRRTPLLEAYKLGTRFERAFETLLREAAAGIVPPDKTESFLAQGQHTLEESERWLAEFDQPDLVGLAAFLKPMRPEWVLDGLVKTPSDLSARVKDDADRETLRRYLELHTGFSSAFLDFFLEGDPSHTLRSLTEAFVGWLLCVEYVHDLTRAPFLAELQPLKSLSPPLRKTCLELVSLVRQRYPDDYRVYAMQTEGLLESELDAGSAEELGKIDTFCREDTRLLEGALACLEEERWGPALAWSKERLEAPSVWVQNDLIRRQEWSLVQDAARLGQALLGCRQPLKGARNLEEAIERYIRPDGPHTVDRAHRHFEQERLQLLSPQLPYYPALTRAATLLRTRYRDWLDELNGAFSDLCAREGFLPPAELQQRHLYEQVVHPLTQAADARVAFFMVDALRFEMAAELSERMEGQVHLRARFSELPSITSVGMNVLAPLSRDGSLTLESRPFSGFRAREYSVNSPKQRVRAMGERSLDRPPLLLNLADIPNSAPEKLAKQVKSATLVVVHSREIDGSGEADVGLATFDRWLGQLRSAVHHLRNAGVEEFVITSDHGFLILDDTREPLVYHGDFIDRRFILTDSPVTSDALTTVPLKSLNYGGAEGYLMFVRDSRVFKKGTSASTFVHGGNSLQERVIPVLTLSYKTSRPMKLARYRLRAEVLAPMFGCHRIKVLLENVSDGVLNFAVPPILPIALRVPDMAVEPVVQEAVGARLINQQLHLQLGQWAEICFKLEGPGDKARLELFHPDGTEQVEILRLPEFFDVLTKGAITPVLEQVLSWVDHFSEPGVVRVFQHVESFGSVDEAELVGMLGSPREVRKFARHFEEYLPLLPFHVRMEVGSCGKRYLKA